MWTHLALLACFCLSTLAAPAILKPDTDPEQTPGFFEGDMNVAYTRNGLVHKTRHWPNATVYYKIDQMFDAEHVTHIKLGMQMIEDGSCIRFQEADDQVTNFVLITGQGNGCNSNVGYLGGQQKINMQLYPVGKGCFILGKVVHELLHTVGFRHQQNSPDRDNYVIINEENIENEHAYAFKKYSESELSNYGVPYDLNSIMHYGPLVFSKNSLPTIVPLRPEEATQMGQRKIISQADMGRINIMYNCPAPTETTTQITTTQTEPTEQITVGLDLENES